MSDAFERSGDLALLFEAALAAEANTAAVVMTLLGDRLAVAIPDRKCTCPFAGELVDNTTNAFARVVGDLLVYVVALLRLREHGIGSTPADTVRLLNEGETG